MRIGLYLLLFAFVWPVTGQQPVSEVKSFTVDSTLRDTNPEVQHSRIVNLDTIRTIMKKDDFVPFDHTSQSTLPDSVLKNAVRVPYEPKSDVFLEKYMEVVYRQTTSPDSTNKSRMRLWKAPLKIYVDPSVTEEDKQALEDFAERIDLAVDSLRIAFVPSPEASNYIVYYTSEEFTSQYEANLLSSREGYYIYWKGGQITRGSLKVDATAIKDPAIRRGLLLWRFYLSLGYFEPLGNLPCTEYLSRCFSPDKELSESDLEILKYHYSYGICKGTRITEFKEQHRLARESMAQNPNNEFYFIHLQ
jgi:hypothetical protein